jgi:hypothetical protein
MLKRPLRPRLTDCGPTSFGDLVSSTTTGSRSFIRERPRLRLGGLSATDSSAGLETAAEAAAAVVGCENIVDDDKARTIVVRQIFKRIDIPQF